MYALNIYLDKRAYACLLHLQTLVLREKAGKPKATLNSFGFAEHPPRGPVGRAVFCPPPDRKTITARKE